MTEESKERKRDIIISLLRGLHFPQQAGFFNTSIKAPAMLRAKHSVSQE